MAYTNEIGKVCGAILAKKLPLGAALGRRMKRPKLGIGALVVALVLLGVSVALAILIFPKINTDVMLPYAIVGYALTPFGVAAALIWARSRDLKFQGNPLYFRLDGQTRIKQVGAVVGISFIPAFLHIWYVASYVREMLS